MRTASVLFRKSLENLKTAAAVILLSATLGCTSEYTAEQLARARDLAFDENLEKRCEETPAKFYVEQVRRNCYLRHLVRDDMALNYSTAVKNLSHISQKIRDGLDWNLPPAQCRIPYLDKAPVIDGIMPPGEWEKALTFHGEYQFSSREKESASGTVWKIGYDKEYLYVALQVIDPEVVSWSGRIHDAKKKPFYLGDCFELLVRPEPDQLLYYEFLLNPAGEVWDMRHGHLTQYGRWQQLSDDLNTGRKTAVKVYGNRLTYETAIPLRMLYGKWTLRGPLPGDRFSMMPIHCDRTGNRYRQYTPYPLLYDSHNIYGYLQCELQSR